MNGFFRFILNMGKVKQKADAIRADESKRAESTVFGVRSVIFSVLALVFAVAAFFLIKLMGDADGDMKGALMTAFIVIALIICVVGALLFLLHSVIRLGFQFKINKKPICWIALAVLLVAAAGICVAPVLIF